MVARRPARLTDGEPAVRRGAGGRRGERLGLGQRDDAAAAIDQALTADPSVLSARIMAAILAVQRDDEADVARHLAQLESELNLDAVSDEEQPVLLRQLAMLHERCGNLERADALYTQLRELDDSLDHRTEHARHLLRTGRSQEAATLLERSLADHGTTHADDQVAQGLINEIAQAHFHHGGARAAADRMGEYPTLGLDNQRLYAQLLLADGQFERAAKILDELLDGEGGGDRGARILLIRSLLAQQQYAEATAAAARLYTEDTTAVDAATSYAECLAYVGDYRHALRLLLDERLGEPQTAERILLTACLLFECVSTERAVAWLARHLKPDARLPLVRLLGTAFPDAIDIAGKPEPDDYSSIPPFPRLAERLASALGQRNQHALAAKVLLFAAHHARQCQRTGEARRLRRCAVTPLIRAGERQGAFAAAWQGGNPLLLLRCLWPR